MTTARTTANVANGSGSKRVLVVILAIIGVAAIAIGVLFFAAPSVLPHLFFAHNQPRTGHHAVRAAVSAGVGVIALVIAGMVGRGRRS
jgi:hypothetical protein